MALATALAALVSPLHARADEGADAQVRDEQADTQPVDSARQQVVLWTFAAPGLSPSELTEIRKGLQAALNEETGRHLFGEKAFRSYVAQTSASLPQCLKGLAPCLSAQTLAFEALDVSLVIRVAISGGAGGLSARAELVDRRGEVARRHEASADSPTELAYTLAGEIFDATGTVSMRTEPAGAAVEIGGKEVGTTPLNYRLPLGEHAYVLRLEDHRPIEGRVKLAGAGATIVQHEFEQLPGVLVIDSAPADARVFVNDEERGPAGEPLELEPGSYTIEVRAEGFDSFRDTVTLAAGQQVRREASLEESHPLLKDIETHSIAVNRYIGRLSYDHSLHKTTYRGARGEVEGTRLEFAGFRDADQPSLALADERRLAAPNGLRFDFTYSWTNLGLVLMSTSFVSTDLDQQVLVRSSGSESLVPATISGISRLQIRPLQVRYRYFYKNFAPFAELGTGINIQWLDVDGELLERPVTLSNSEAFWSLGIGGAYYFTPNIFGMLRYGAQFYIDEGLGTESVLSLGVGVALPNLFGFEPEPPERL
jgi:hypothetical protein